MTPLFEALTGNPKALVWNAAMVKVYHDTKLSLADTTLLALPCQNASISLITDASNIAVGLVLQQYVKESWVPLAFFSQKLAAQDRKYGTFDCELLTLYLSVQNFHYFLEGRKFFAFIDHKPLTHCISKVSVP